MVWVAKYKHPNHLTCSCRLKL